MKKETTGSQGIGRVRNVQVQKERLPWWRWALDFALGGIRSGFGLFRRNGKVEPSIDTTAQAAIAEHENEGTEVSAEGNFGPEVIEAESIAEEYIDQQSCLEPEVTEIESRTEKSTGTENSLERENKESEVDSSEEKPAEVESGPEPETRESEFESSAEEAAEAECEIAALNVTFAADEATEPDIALILPVELPESDAPELAPTEEETALTDTSPQSDGTTTRSGREDAFDREPSPPAKEPPESAPAPPAIEPPEPAPPAQEPPESEPVPPAEEPPAPESPEPVHAAPAAGSTAVSSAAPRQEASSPLPFDAPVAPNPPSLDPLTPEPPAPEKTTAEKVAAALKARGVDAEQSPFSVFVGQVYDGPLDLLLDLIRKQDIDIYDIPIAKITAQFLAYVDHLRASDMDVAGDFIYTAALLIHIKSKMLLPRAPVGPEESTEDPRRELVDRLLEHERFKNAAQMLHEKQMLEAATWSNPGVREFREDAGAEPEIAADTTDLVRIFRDILERARNRPILNVEEDSVTVGQMIQFLTRRLTMEDKPVALRRLLSHTHSERALIAMFLGLLELVRLQAILLRQDRQFSEIFVKKNTGFDAVVNDGLASAHDDWR